MDHNRRAGRLNVKDEYHALSRRDIKPFEISVDLKIDRLRIRSLDYTGCLLGLQVLAMDDTIFTS